MLVVPQLQFYQEQLLFLLNLLGMMMRMKACLMLVVSWWKGRIEVILDLDFLKL